VIQNSFLPGALLIAGVGIHAHGETQVSAPILYSGMCDASAAVALTDKLFAAASDEGSVIRVYDRDRQGAPLQNINLSAFLDLDARKPEADLEGAARSGDRAYWITSHGRNKSGKDRRSRDRFFAVQIVTNAQRVELNMLGKPYEHLLDDLMRDPKLKPFNLAAASKLEPKARGALNIEGLSATPQGWLLIGFRNPIPGGKALLVPMLNPDAVIHGQAAIFGEPILLDLGGLGIRDMAYWDGQYAIIAGPYDGKGQSRLYEWLGGASTPRLVKHAHLKSLNPEAIIFYPDNGGEQFQLLSDDGKKLVNGKPCKELADPSQQHFRSIWISERQGKGRLD
jgi:hypothetical protein